MEDVLFVVRKSPRLFAKAEDLLTKQRILKAARKGFDVRDEEEDEE